MLATWLRSRGAEDHGCPVENAKAFAEQTCLNGLTFRHDLNVLRNALSLLQVEAWLQFHEEGVATTNSSATTCLFLVSTSILDVSDGSALSCLQVEERLRFYEEGVAPTKNLTAMQVRCMALLL